MVKEPGRWGEIVCSAMELYAQVFSSWRRDAGLVARVGTVVSSGTVVWQAEEKRRLRRLTDATGLDMESAAVAADGAGTRPADGDRADGFRSGG